MKKQPYVFIFANKVDQFYFLKERDWKKSLEEKDNQLKEMIDELNVLHTECDNMKKQRVDSVRDYKNTAIDQIGNLMENLIQKDKQIQVSALYFSTVLNLIVEFLIVKKSN
jgi:hypothetical protein